MCIRDRYYESFFVHYQIVVCQHCRTVHQTVVNQSHSSRNLLPGEWERQYADDRRLWWSLSRRWLRTSAWRWMTALNIVCIAVSHNPWALYSRSAYKLWEQDLSIFPICSDADMGMRQIKSTTDDRQQTNDIRCYITSGPHINADHWLWHCNCCNKYSLLRY